MENRRERVADPRNVDIREVERAGDEFINNLAGEFDRLVIENGQIRIIETPGQMQRDREDEVENTAGGFVFPVSDTTRIRRFLILGSSGGTYYSTEKELTMDNVSALVDIIDRGKGSEILREIVEISTQGRNPKQEPVMLALALCCRYRVNDCHAVSKSEPMNVRMYATYILEMHKASISVLNEVCRIPTHLFAFVKYAEMVSAATNTVGTGKSSGWGRLMRTAISNWYAAKTPENLALHLTKYRQRDGWSHRDLFRLAHPVPSKSRAQQERLLEVEQLYRYAVKGVMNPRKRRLSQEDWDLEQPQEKYSAEQLDNELNSKALDLVDAFSALNAETPEETVINAIREHNLVREHIPTEHLNSVGVWQALLEHMPMTAMVRNLGKMTAIGALNEQYTKKVVEQLTNEDELKKSKIHPIQILLAKTVYQSGHGDKGKLTWEVNKEVDEALEQAFYKSFINAPPTGKRFCFAFDISGSMCSQISGTMLSCRTASAALSLISLRNEQNYECVGFSESLIELPYNAEWTIKRIEEHMDQQTFGATDCAQPMLWAKEHKKEIDVFVVYTDCETWSGEVKPYAALQQYREASGIRDAKLIVMGMTSTGFSIADPNDAGMLDIVGFDSAVPQLIHDFVTGQL